MNTDCRIKLDDSTLDAITKLSEGNPGAINVMMRALKEGGDIDPDSFAGGFGVLLSLDSYSIYGSRIWMLYKDVCGTNLAEMQAVLRAVQLGLIPEAEMQTAIDNYGQGLTENIMEMVQESLPDFAKTC